MKRNPHFASLPSLYLFQEIKQRVGAFCARVPDAAPISLGIGDTSSPLALPIAEASATAARALATPAGYSGYGPEAGHPELRQRIAHALYAGRISPDDVFISDGAKCDIARLQVLFGKDAVRAFQDPTYPVYRDSTTLTAGTDTSRLLPCTPENRFIPDVTRAIGADVLFLCSPNNPTGTAFDEMTLRHIVSFARQHRMLIVFDTAYSFYLPPGSLRSIYEIPGAETVAIEVGSFSKMAGFSGVRLGWTIVPEALRYADGSSVRQDWMRLVTTLFNGASILAQRGGMAALSDEGLAAIRTQTTHYLENTRRLRDALHGAGYDVYGGSEAPYVWARIPGSGGSWQAFHELLERYQLITTPGIGFGPSGEGFLRASGLGRTEDVEEAIRRLRR